MRDMNAFFIRERARTIQNENGGYNVFVSLGTSVYDNIGMWRTMITQSENLENSLNGIFDEMEHDI